MSSENFGIALIFERQKNERLTKRIATLENKLKESEAQEELLIQEIERLESEIENLNNVIEIMKTGVSKQSTPGIKQCAKCGKNRKRSSFYRSDRNADGLTKWCKFCWDKEHKSR